MTPTSSIDDLSARIERVVQEHIAASRKAAEAAVGRAFESASSNSPARRSARQTRGRRRSPSEVAALADRLYEAVCAHPGETMAVIAPHVGELPRALSRPMTHLKRADRVRSAGQRHMTRYFPLS